MNDELSVSISKFIAERGPIRFEELCDVLNLWPRAGISRRLQAMRKNGKIFYKDRAGWICIKNLAYNNI